MTVHHIELSKTMQEFMDSKAYVRCMFGPIASGKSVLSVMTLFKWACEQKFNQAGERKTRFLIIRNTNEQLRTTTLKTVLDWVPPEIGTYKVSEKTLYIDFHLPDGSRVVSEWLFLPLDTPDDIRKCLSLEATAVWINEGREVSGDIVDALLTRTDRYPSRKDGGASRAGGIVDTNSPDVDSWWHAKFESPPKNWSIHRQPPAMLSFEEYLTKYGEDPDEDLIAESNQEEKFVVNPEADNLGNLSRQYYPAACEGKTIDHIDVYLRCRYGRSLSGLPVFDRTFNKDFHVAAADAPMVAVRSESMPIIVGVDQGRTPAAVFGQMDLRGRLNVLSEVVAENMGMETFIAEKLRPHIQQKYPGFSFVVAPDPASWQRSQVNEVSPADVLRKAGFKLVRPATNKPELRIQAVERFLVRQVDGKAAFLVNPECVHLVRALHYGYRYKLRKGGNMDDVPEKNMHSHISDALQYLCLVAEGSHVGWKMARVDWSQVEVLDCSGWV